MKEKIKESKIKDAPLVEKKANKNPPVKCVLFTLHRITDVSIDHLTIEA